MSAVFGNTLLFLLYIFNLLTTVWLLRILLQLVRADFYNPISQLIWRATRYPADALRRFLPPIGRFDTALAAVLFAISLIYVRAHTWIIPESLPLMRWLLLALGNILVQLIYLYSAMLVIQAVLSWFGPGVNNPSSNILWSLNEPLLRPVRRILPPTPGIDLAPMVVLLVLQFVAQALLPAFFR